MKVFCLSVLESKPNGKSRIKAIEHDLSTFSYFQRSSIQEAINFFVLTVVDRTKCGDRATVEQNNYTTHVYLRLDGLAGAIVTDAEYPQRVAFSIIAKTLDEFASKFQQGSRDQITIENSGAKYPELHDHLLKSQDPESNDPFMKVQRELDETKVILVFSS